MTRFKNIQMLEAPDNIEKWYKTAKYALDRITVFRLHHMLTIDEKQSGIFRADIIKKLSKEDRSESKRIHDEIGKESDISKIKYYFDNKIHRELSNEYAKRMCYLNKDVYKEYYKKIENEYSDDDIDRIVELTVETMKMIDISSKILKILEEDLVRDPKDFSVLAQLIGISNNDKMINYLYSFYMYFINNFPEDNYFEGPLLGISYFIERRRRTTASTG